MVGISFRASLEFSTEASITAPAAASEHTKLLKWHDIQINKRMLDF